MIIMIIMMIINIVMHECAPTCVVAFFVLHFVLVGLIVSCVHCVSCFELRCSHKSDLGLLLQPSAVQAE